MGALVAASLPNCGARFKKDLQDKLLEQVDWKDLTKARCLEIVVNWLDRELEEDKMYKCVRSWREFEACKYLDRFQYCCEGVTLSSKTAILPEEIRAFMVLRRADVTDAQRKLRTLRQVST